MKILRFDELIDNEPEIGDYIICDIGIKTILYDFINNHISKLTNTYLYGELQQIYVLEFDDIPSNILKYFTENVKNGKIFYNYDIGRGGIKSWSKNKEELELKLAANKFNI